MDCMATVHADTMHFPFAGIRINQFHFACEVYMGKVWSKWIKKANVVLLSVKPTDVNQYVIDSNCGVSTDLVGFREKRNPNRLSRLHRKSRDRCNRQGVSYVRILYASSTRV